MQALLWPIISWLLRTVVIKFVVLAGIVGAVSFLVPIAINYIGNFTSTTGLTAAFAALPDGVQFMALYFRIDYGLPLLISATVARFLIRRLPVIG
jgi:hypothetical protein